MKTKHCKFTANFRQTTVAVAEAIGLEFNSSKRQVENGTLEFYDPQTDTRYSMHESGYIRRYIKSAYYFSLESAWKGYQLNRVVKSANTSYPSWNGGKAYTFKSNVRVMADPVEQLGILVKAVTNYRKKYGN